MQLAPTKQNVHCVWLRTQHFFYSTNFYLHRIHTSDFFHRISENTERKTSHFVTYSVLTSNGSVSELVTSILPATWILYLHLINFPTSFFNLLFYIKNVLCKRNHSTVDDASWFTHTHTHTHTHTNDDGLVHLQRILNVKTVLNAVGNVACINVR
jgi:hypothetical protein